MCKGASEPCTSEKDTLFQWWGLCMKFPFYCVKWLAKMLQIWEQVTYSNHRFYIWDWHDKSPLCTTCIFEICLMEWVMNLLEPFLKNLVLLIWKKIAFSRGVKHRSKNTRTFGNGRKNWTKWQKWCNWSRLVESTTGELTQENVRSRNTTRQHSLKRSINIHRFFWLLVLVVSITENTW